jgi:hypothetical protein
MNSRRLMCLLLLALIGIGLAAQDAAAIPVFARKYGFECTMCHSNIPRLNDFGQLYRMNGYRLPGREDAEKTVLDVQAPVAFRTSAGYNLEQNNDASGLDDLAAMQLNGLDLLSAGLLARNIGYSMVYVPHYGESRGVVGQDGALEMASVVFSGLARTWLNVRVGRYEPAYVPFSVKRQLGVAPYEVLDMSFPGGPASSETQTGIEVSGFGRNRFAYAAGLVMGSETNAADDNPTDVYGRASYVFGAGQGQTAGQRIGVLSYLGQARPFGHIAAERENFTRVGADVSLNALHCNLAAQYLYFLDDPTLWGRPATEDQVTWSGGFAELSCLPHVNVVAFARYDYVDAPSVDNKDVNRATVGVRYYVVDNCALHGEYSYRSVKSLSPGVDDATLSFFTARVDFAF